MTVKKITYDGAGFTVEFMRKGHWFTNYVFKNTIWDSYIVPNKYHITGDGETYEMDEFFELNEMITKEFVKRWMVLKQS